ncbi:MAG: diguanylate cyclase, partial [Acidobacteria bacterium]|nr:diguanylate cyclase [Acidobacteriota bacterium]MYA46615.1 diguanylate cyclase [Acidobacteriota bacterium]MYI37540.1 diguanylate cyclase [Acidobacteriota bacterium]
MGRQKRGADGYRSFAYLTPGEDYAPQDLVDDAELFPAHPVPLSAEEEARAERLAGELVLISLHEHLGSFPRDIHRTPAYVREGRVFTPFEALAQSDWDCVFDNLLDGICRIESRTGWKWNEVLHDLGMRLADIAHQDFLI